MVEAEPDDRMVRRLVSGCRVSSPHHCRIARLALASADRTLILQPNAIATISRKPIRADVQQRAHGGGGAPDCTCLVAEQVIQVT